MPSTYTASGIELIADGEQSGTWGQTTNTNLQIINRMTSEFVTIALSGTTHTLTISDGTLSDGQYGVLIFNGSPSGTNTVTISPNDARRVFMVENTSGQTVIMTQGSGGNVSILDGDGAIVYCNGGGASAAVLDIGSTLKTTNNLVVADNLSDLASASTARTNLGVAIGSNVQAWDANLDQIAALAVTDGNIIVGNGSAWVAESGATARTSLGLTIGTNVQAWDANLDQIAALAVTDGNFIVGNGSAWVAESGATARTSLGLGSIALLNTVTLGTDTTGNYVATNVAGAGIDVSGSTGNVTISLEADLRGDVTHVGPDTTDYITWTDNSHTSFFVNGDERVRIESDGDLHADGNVIAYSTTISDPRLKHDIVKIDGALDKVMQINGYTFTYNKDGVRSAGVLSTEVAKVLPSAIRPTKLPLQGGDDVVYDTVQYDQIHGLLIEAIKEQQAQIEALMAEVSALKG
jgi:hypothetical protein